jgi:DNA topoisomerase-1
LKLIVVESPAKASTIEKFLGKGYRVAASNGHIRDLPEKASQIPPQYQDKPWKRLAVDVDGGYEPIYVQSPKSKQAVATLKKLLAQADELLLATDEDREGEAISWHVLEVLKPKIPVRRITFHEITREAIQHAIANPREVDHQVVRAQESRRILDRLYGYELSPVLWKKVRTGLSAGRVQSVAVRLIVEREEARQRFVRAVYFDVEALLYGPGGQNFTARLHEIDGVRLAGGKDFDPETGRLLQPQRRLLLDAAAAEAIQTGARAAAALPWRVVNVDRKETRQRPAPPFITSTLQQAASTRLRLSPAETMKIAQRLYEGIELGGGERVGLITYMRTDSLHLAASAQREAASVVRCRFGDEFTDGPRSYKTKSKGAQEAHEAIRPTSFARAPEDLADALTDRELALYRLIYDRALASQMTDARLDKTTADLACRCGGRQLLWRANGSIVTFPGFLRVYGERERDSLLPDLQVGQLLPDPQAPLDEEPPQGVAEVRALRHETQAPARFSEASLVKALEDEGIGRPSTYASIISTIQLRGYVQKKNGVLLPTYVGMAVVRLLRDHFPRYVDVRFTAGMEEELDAIARGEVDWRDFLHRFYRGSADDPGLVERIAGELERIEFPAIPIGEDPKSGEPLRVKIGRKSVYVQAGEGGTGASVTLPDDLMIDDLTPAAVHDLLAAKRKSLEPIGQDPATGKNIYALLGPYGPYLQLGENDDTPKPKRVSLGRGTDLSKVDLELARRLLSLPRELGVDPRTGVPVRAGLGRFGPFVVREKTFASLASADQLFSITLEEALRRIEDKEAGKKPALAELGPHPETGEMLRVCKGRYGSYVTDGSRHASLPKDREPASVTVAEAVAWLAAAAERKGGSRRRRASAVNGESPAATGRARGARKDASRRVAKSAKKSAKKGAKKSVKKSAKKSAKTTSRSSPTDGASTRRAAGSGTAASSPMDDARSAPKAAAKVPAED